MGQSGEVARLDLPARIPHELGSTVTARYQAERGMPGLSTLTFWGGGVPCALLGAGFLTAGIVSSVSEPDASGSTDRDLTGFYFGASAMFFVYTGAATWWYLWSHPASFDTVAEGAATARALPPKLLVGPGFVSGTF